MNSEFEYISEGMIFHGTVPMIMGTRLEALIVGVPEREMCAIWEKVCIMLSRQDALLNRFNPESEVSRLNISANPLDREMSSELAEIVYLAQDYNLKTNRLFDIAAFEGKLDFGGFGKGYFLKKCAELLRQDGVECAFVNFGNSSILGMGHHPYGENWAVGVVNPYTNKTIREVMLRDRTISTSGNTPAYSGHIINPHTGIRCDSRKMVTVVAADPLDAEVLSTALMLADHDDEVIIKKNFPDAEWETMNL